MEFSDTVKIEEDRKVIIDLGDGDSPEDIVVEWHLEMRRFFNKNTAVVGENNLMNVMKEYIQSITSRAIHFEDIETLQVMVEKHIEHIYWLYREMDLCFSDTYLDNMEHIMTFYLNLRLRTLLALKRKLKVTHKMVAGMTEDIVKRISRYLLESEYHIFHVLIRQTTTSVDDVVKDVLNILQSNICKQLFKNLYKHFLILSPIRDKSDEAFCRVYILFENWKAFEDNRQNEEADEVMRVQFGRGPECIKDNKFLTRILQPQVSVIGELMRVVGYDPGITKSYFDYIKSRQKQEFEILEDIEKLALEDRGWQEDDEEDDEEYSELYDKMVGDTVKERFVEIQNNMEMKEENKFKSLNVAEDDEVIYCGSDSDSDIEIVSVKPSSSFGNSVNERQKLYIHTLKNTSASKPSKTSFLDSISIDDEFDSRPRMDTSSSRKDLLPNPLSELFRNCDLDKQLPPKQLNGDSVSLSKKENGASEATSNDSEAVGKFECSSIIQSAVSCSESETLSASQDLRNFTNNSIETDIAQSRYSEDNSKTNDSLCVTVESDVSEKNRIDSINSKISISKSLENTCINETINARDYSHPESLKGCTNSISESSGIISRDSVEELPKINDGSCENQIQKTDTLSRNIQQTESKIEESFPIINQTYSLSENYKPIENSLGTNVNLIDVSSQSKMEIFKSANNGSTFPLVDRVQEVVEDSSYSIKKNINKDPYDLNSNAYTTSLSKAISSSHKENSLGTHVNLIDVSSNSQIEIFKSGNNGSTFQLEDRVQEMVEDSNNSIKNNVNRDSNAYTTFLPQATNSSHKEEMNIVRNSSCSYHQKCCEMKTMEPCNKNDVVSPEPSRVSRDVENRLNYTNNSENISQTSPRLSSNNDVNCGTFANTNVGTVANTNVGTFANTNVGTFANTNVGTFANTNVGTFANTNVQSEQTNKWPDHQFDAEIHLQSDEQLDRQSSQAEKQINYRLKVSSVCQINNIIEQNSLHAQTDESVQSSKSQDGIVSAANTPRVNSNKLSEMPVRCNGFQIFKELRNNDSTLRKGELKLKKRRHSVSNVYECSRADRRCANFEEDSVRDKSDLKVDDSRCQESDRPSKVRVNGQSGASMFLDTGQCVPAQPPLDTGQAQVIEEISAPVTDPSEELVRDVENPSDSKTAQHICSEKRTKSQSGKDELCGYPTPPGSEEDVDDTQPDPVYSKIFPTPTCSATGDCYRTDRTVFRLNSESERDATVDEIATTGQIVSQTSPVDNRKDSPAEIVVPEIVYSEQTMSENDFLTEDIDPGDPLVSLEEEELLERLSDEEKNEESESGNMTKSFAQIASAAVGDHDHEDVNKQTRYVNESGLNRKAPQRTPSPSKKQLTSPKNDDDFDEMAQFLENCGKQYDSYDASTPPGEKRKRQIKDVRFESSPQPREKSQIKRRKMGRKVETRIKSFEEFEAEVWNQQSPIAKYVNDCYSSDTDETTGLETTRPNSRTNRIGTPTAKEKPSPMPFSNHVRLNGTTMDSPPLSCATSTPKQPPLRGILKKFEQSHSYHPLHPVDDDPASSFVYIPLEPDPVVERDKKGTEGSRIKVSRKSLNACKVSRDYQRLFERYSRVSLDHVWRNKNLEWEKISDPSKRLLWEMMPQRLYRIDYDKTTKDSLNYQIYFIEQPATDESSTIANTRNPNLEIQHGTGTVNLSNEIVCIETTDFDLAHAVQFHVPSISPCLSPSSNASSEFSDPTNLIPYQDIERALQVVEPDDQTCYSCSANEELRETSDQVDSGDVLDNMSVEAIKLLSNNADFHKIFCDFEGEILIENVPVLDTDETESILNIDGAFVKPLPKVDVRLSDKLTEDLILNLNSDEELLKKICQELETKSLVDSISNSADNAARMNNNEFLNFSEDAHQDASRLSPLAKTIADKYSNVNAFSRTTSSIESAEREFEPVNAFSQNSTISLAKSGLNSPSSIPPTCSENLERSTDEFHSVDYQLNSQTNNQECINIQHSNNFKTDDAGVRTIADIQEPLHSNSQIIPKDSRNPLAFNQYFQSAQVNTQSFQISQMYQTSQVSSQVFQSSRIGQPLVCSPLKDPSFQNLQKPSLIVNLPMPRDSLNALSKKKSGEHTTSNAHNNISPTILDVEPNSNASLYNSINPLQVLPGTLEPLQMDIIPAHHLQSLNDVSSSTNINIGNAFILPSENKPKTGRRGRPPKKSKKLKEKPQKVPVRDKRPPLSDHYPERVPPIYHQELLPLQKYVVRDQGKSQQDASEVARDENKVHNESGASSSKRASNSKRAAAVDNQSGASSSKRAANSKRVAAVANGKQKLLPMPVPQTFNFETDTLKQEVYNIRLESGKVDNCENDAEFETHLPLKKRKLSMPVPITSSIPILTPSSKPITSSLSSHENVESKEISYPATPMLSIADLYIPTASRPFKTPAEKKQLPVDPPPLPIRYDLPNDTTPFTCSMNTFASNVYRLNECPYNVKLDCPPYCPPPPVMFPPESFSRSN